MLCSVFPGYTLERLLTDGVESFFWGAGFSRYCDMIQLASPFVGDSSHGFRWEYNVCHLLESEDHTRYSSRSTRCVEGVQAGASEQGTGPGCHDQTYANTDVTLCLFKVNG